MAIAPAGTVFAGGEGGTSHTEWVATLTAGAAVGSTILGTITLSAASSLPRNIDSITDSKGNTWSVDVQPVISGATLQTGIVRGRVTTALVSGDTVTFNITPGSNQWGVVLGAFTGLDAAPLDKVGSNAPGNASTGTVSSAAATAQADELVFAGFGTALGTTTPGTGFTSLGTGAGTTRQTSAQYRIASSTGVQTATATFNPASTYVGVLATYKATVVTNVPPTANAGADQVDVEPYSTVTLTGSGTDSDGTVTGHTWRQIITGSEPTVTLAGSGTGPRTFEAPPTMDGAVFTFGLKVTDNAGATSTEATMTVTVRPWDRFVRRSGAWVPRPLSRTRTSSTWQ